MLNAGKAVKVSIYLSEGSAYHGWLQVDPDEDGSRLTLFVATVHGDAPDPEVMGTLDAIRRLVEADV